MKYGCKDSLRLGGQGIVFIYRDSFELANNMNNLDESFY